MKALYLLILVMVGCGQPAEVTVCDSICDTLVKTCEYDAYPSYDSCVQGCEYNESQGAKVDRAATCIEDAECDTFKIIECEHAPGVDIE